MPIIRVQVHYKLGLLGKWSNVWHVQADDLPSASAAFGGEAVPHLLPLLHVSCLLDRLLISDPLTHTFVTTPIVENGTNGDIGDMLPLWNTVKPIFDVPGFGRPDLKYLKGLLTEGMQTNGLINAPVVTAVDTELTSMIADMVSGGAPLCSDTGQLYDTVTVQQAVQMRQMHRKRKKHVVVTV